MKKLLIFIVVCFWPFLVLSQTDTNINKHHYYANFNEKIHNLIPLPDGFKIAYSYQASTEAPILRLMNEENLVVDSLDMPIYFHDIIPMENQILLTTNESSYLIPFDNTGFKSNQMIMSEYEYGNFEKVLMWKGKRFGWNRKREGKRNIGWQLVANDEILIEEIPKRILKRKDNPNKYQRHLNQRHYFLNGQFVIVWFKSQRVYFLTPENENLTFFDFPVEEGSIWYYFPDIATGKHYLVKESNNDKYELYGFYLGSGVKKLFDLANFPDAIYDRAVLYKESDQNKNQTHYFKPFKAYYSN